jgi:hypothetical protein
MTRAFLLALVLAGACASPIPPSPLEEPLEDDLWTRGPGLCGDECHWFELRHDGDLLQYLVDDDVHSYGRWTTEGYVEWWAASRDAASARGWNGCFLDEGLEIATFARDGKSWTATFCAHDEDSPYFRAHVLFHRIADAMAQCKNDTFVEPFC